MLKRLKRLFKRKPKQFLVLSKKSFTLEQALEVRDKFGLPVIVVNDPNDVKIIGEDIVEKEFPDGKAEFLGSGTEQEFIDQQREDDGSKPWYERLKNL